MMFTSVTNFIYHKFAIGMQMKNVHVNNDSMHIDRVLSLVTMYRISIKDKSMLTGLRRLTLALISIKIF